MVKMGFPGLWDAMGWYKESVCLLAGESVENDDCWGGRRGTFFLSPKTSLGGELVEWRLFLRGERPLVRVGGGYKTISAPPDMSLDEVRLDEAGLAINAGKWVFEVSLGDGDGGSWKTWTRRVEAMAGGLERPNPSPSTI